jgi:TonB family protein
LRIVWVRFEETMMSDATPRGPKSLKDAKSEDGAEDSGASGATYLPAAVIDSRGAVVKWMVGAAAVAVLVGGGFAVWKNTSRGDARTEIAAADLQTPGGQLAAPQASAPMAAAGPLAGTEATVTPEVQPDSASAPSKPVRSRTKARTEAVPTAVLGVTPVSTTTEENEIVITRDRGPVWAKTPTSRRLSAMYPERALERGREGEASIRCMVQASGALDCTRVSEFPARSGFGNAALRIARTYRHAPQRWDGRDAVGTPVNLRVVFRLEDDGRRRG